MKSASLAWPRARLFPAVLCDLQPSLLCGPEEKCQALFELWGLRFSLHFFLLGMQQRKWEIRD
jgi:hypothetical protein